MVRAAAKSRIVLTGPVYSVYSGLAQNSRAFTEALDPLGNRSSGLNGHRWASGSLIAVLLDLAVRNLFRVSAGSVEARSWTVIETIG